MTEQHEIDITGELPLEFEGDLLFEDSNSWTNGSDNNRYHRLTIYYAADGLSLGFDPCYAVNIEFITHWQGENSFSECWVAKEKEDIRAILDSYDPLAHLVGFPHDGRYEQKQKKLIDKLTFDWNQLKIEAMKHLGFKRMGRPTISCDGKVRTRTNVTVDPKLLSFAKDNNINLSEVLNNELDRLAQQS